MIAYDHHINFIPKLRLIRNSSSNFLRTITVKEHSVFELEAKFLYKHRFFISQGRDITLYSDKQFSPAKSGDLWGFEVEDIAIFFWVSGTEILHYVPHNKLTPQLLQYWTLHIVLPLFFTIEETYDFLHAGAVEVEGKAILFVAESFGGKSTMTDYFLKQGHTLLSDDKMPTYEENGVFVCTASIPFHRPYRKLEDLGYYVEKIAKNPKPIHAIYELDRSDPHTQIIISELHGIDKFIALRYSSEYNLSFLKSKRFAYISRLAKAVRAYRVTVPWDMKRLSKVYSAICEHVTLLRSD